MRQSKLRLTAVAAAGVLALGTVAACGSSSDSGDGGGGGGGGGGTWTLKTSSSTAMLAALKKATDSQEPIVVTLWHPHWAYTAFKLKDLKDPKGAMGKPDSIHTIASKDFNSSNPDVTNALKKFHMDDATLSDLEKVVLQENPKDSAKGAEEWVKANPDVVSKMLPDSVDGSGDTVTIGIAAGWAEDVAVTALWKQVLEDHGFTVETKELDVAPVFVGVSKGDLDLFFDTWLPTTHADYWKKYGDQVVDLGVWYDKAPLTITVPTYMKDVNSIADLKKSSVGDEVDWDITGIDPGAGLTKVTKQAMKAYGLD